FKLREQEGATDEDRWVIPYLPLDPKDVGRTYEAVIRVNSQSGKGGVAWVIQRSLGLDLPRGMQIAFSKVVQVETEKVSRELKPREIQALFEQEYFMAPDSEPRIHLVDYEFSTDRSASPLAGLGRQS